ncbi:MAG: transposase [Pseudomonadales bacterium]
MPRRPRVTLPGIAHHIIQRGNNRHACFSIDDDYHTYLEWLHEYAEETRCRVHAYVLMSNHVHLLVTPQEPASLGLLMKKLGQRYVQYFNRTHHRTGTLWEGRFKSCVAAEETYVLACHRYIELNPVRANMVEHPRDYRWSSYGANGDGEENAILTPHPAYLAIAEEDNRRLVGYQALFNYPLNQGVVDRIRGATNGNYALGSKSFQKEIEQLLGRRVSPGIPGRPARAS